MNNIPGNLKKKREHFNLYPAESFLEPWRLFSNYVDLSHHYIVLSENDVDLSDNDVDLSDNDVDLSDIELTSRLLLVALTGYENKIFSY